MTGPPSMEHIALQRLKVGVRQELSREMATLASTAEFSSMIDHVTDRMVLQLRAHVLAEQLPPQTIQHRVRVETKDPRFATWWDHFKATYQHRWWMRWREWDVQTVRTPVVVERTVCVSVRDHWTYPRAGIALPSEFGSPVLVSTWDSTDWAAQP